AMNSSFRVMSPRSCPRAQIGQDKAWVRFSRLGDWVPRSDLRTVCSSVAVIGHLVLSGAALGVLPGKMMEAEALAGRICGRFQRSTMAGFTRAMPMAA